MIELAAKWLQEDTLMEPHLLYYKLLIKLGKASLTNS